MRPQDLRGGGTPDAPAAPNADFSIVTELACEAEANARLTDAAPEPLEALEASNRELIEFRDSLYDSATNSRGEYGDPDDEEAVAELDALIDANRAALAKARP